MANGKNVDETVRIVRVPCGFGGTRPYFICPGAVNGIICGRRVAKLHRPGRYFLCRHCYRLVYTAQNESGSDRARRRAIKVRRNLGGNVSMGTPFPDRPKGMWGRTYSHLRKQACEAEIAARRSFEITAGQFLRRLNQPKRKKGGRD